MALPCTTSLRRNQRKKTGLQTEISNISMFTSSEKRPISYFVHLAFYVSDLRLTINHALIITQRHLRPAVLLTSFRCFIVRNWHGFTMALCSDPAFIHPFLISGLCPSGGVVGVDCSSATRMKCSYGTRMYVAVDDFVTNEACLRHALLSNRA